MDKDRNKEPKKLTEKSKENIALQEEITLQQVNQWVEEGKLTVKTVERGCSMIIQDGVTVGAIVKDFSLDGTTITLQEEVIARLTDC